MKREVAQEVTQEDVDKAFKSEAEEMKGIVNAFVSSLLSSSSCQDKVITNFSLWFQNPTVVSVDFSFFDKELDALVEGEHMFVNLDIYKTKE